MLTEVVANVKNEWGSSITIEEAVKEVAKMPKPKAPKEKKTGGEKKTSKLKAKDKKTEKEAVLVCPICRKGTILKGKSAYGCSEWKSGCKFRLSFDETGDNISNKELEVILKTNFGE